MDVLYTVSTNGTGMIFLESGDARERVAERNLRDTDEHDTIAFADAVHEMILDAEGAYK